MIVEKLSTELERLYDQEELEALSRDLLGFEPPNGDSGKSAIARALAQRCVEQDAVAALLDAVAVSRQKRLVVPAPRPAGRACPRGHLPLSRSRTSSGAGRAGECAERAWTGASSG